MTSHLLRLVMFCLSVVVCLPPFSSFGLFKGFHFCQLSQDLLWVLAGSCHGHVRVVSELCQGCVRVVSGSCQGCVRVMTGLCQGGVRIVSGWCQGHVRVVSGSYQGHVRVMSESRQGHVRVMSDFLVIFEAETGFSVLFFLSSVYTKTFGN